MITFCIFNLVKKWPACCLNLTVLAFRAKVWTTIAPTIKLQTLAFIAKTGRQRAEAVFFYTHTQLLT